MTLYLACFVLVINLVGARQVSLSVEHNLGANGFVAAGQISGDVHLGDGTSRSLVFEREPLNTQSRMQLSKLVEHNRLYKLRVGFASAKPLALTSIPAQCLVAAQCKETIHLHFNSKWNLTAVNFALSHCPCESGVSRSSTLHSSWAFAEEAKVPVWLPETAAPLRLTAKPSQGPDKTAGRTASSGQASPQELAGAAEGKEGEATEAPKDERTWLQKNWLILLPLGFVLVNVMGQMGDAGAPAGSGRAGAARGGAAPAARRR